MPSRRRILPARHADPAERPAPKRQPGVPMLPAYLATTVGTARHDRHLAGVRLGASRRLGSQVRGGQPPARSMSAQDRQHYLQEAAYYRYLQRDGTAGSPEGDWLAAEAELQNTPRGS